MIKVFFDGSCAPRNPGGIGTWGVYIKDVGGKEVELCGVVNDGEPSTNNVAEYTALLEALKWLKKNRVNLPMIQIYGDSQLTINMAGKIWGYHKGKYNPHRDKPHLKVLLEQIHKEAEGLAVMYDWIPREKNVIADQLAEKAYSEHKTVGKKKKDNVKNLFLEMQKFVDSLNVGCNDNNGTDWEFKYGDLDWKITMTNNKANS